MLDNHVPELTEVTQDRKKRLETVYGETAVVFEDLLARCQCYSIRVFSETQGQGVGIGYDQGFQEEAVHAYVYVLILHLFA